MTVKIGASYFPTVMTVPRSWTYRLDAKIIPPGTSVADTYLIIDFLSNEAVTVNLEPVVGYEEVFVFYVAPGAAGPVILTPLFSEDGITWYPLTPVTLNIGANTEQILPAVIKRYPCFTGFRYTIDNTGANNAVVTGVITLRAT